MYKYIYCGVALLLLLPASTLAQDTTPTNTQRPSPTITDTLLEEVIITARKRTEAYQEVPITLSAFNSQQLSLLKVRDLTDLSVRLPNVALDDLGTAPGMANFSIRGLGVNSSIPSIDPTVGVFVDGIYMGLNTGILLDLHDIASIEVLRGPQGTLFGRNVTGGAILIHSKVPSDMPELTLRFALEGGGEKPNTYNISSLSGRMTKNLAGKISLYNNEDRGWFRNLHTNSAHGKRNSDMQRGTLVWNISDDLDMTVRYDHQEISGDGPAAQSHTNGSNISNPTSNFGRDTFDFAINETGFVSVENDLSSMKMDWRVGNGTITNILGWRMSEVRTLGDIDSSSSTLFTSPTYLDSEQLSNELRYSGEINAHWYLTAGLYFFTHDISYHETRNIHSFQILQDGGGEYAVDTTALFATIDYAFNDDIHLIAGLRYTNEKKSAHIANVRSNTSPLPIDPETDSRCNVTLHNPRACPFNFSHQNTWRNTAPKLGISYFLHEGAHLYAHWVRGSRSGGYNLRDTARDPAKNPPGPFDEERVDSYEIGMKYNFARGGHINSAFFVNDIDNMQREGNLPNETSVVEQVIRNTADARIIGAETDIKVVATRNAIFIAGIGLIDPTYQSIFFDLDNDGRIDEADRNLRIPRAAKATFNIGVNIHSTFKDIASLIWRIHYAYRSQSAYTDNNLGFINAQKIFNLGVDWIALDNTLTISLYGKNLLNSVKHGGDTQLPLSIGGGTFAPLAKGAVYGIEATYRQ